MEFQIVQHAISSFKLSDIQSGLKRWDFLSKTNFEHLISTINFKQTKRAVASQISDFVRDKGGLTMQTAGSLGLVAMEMYSSRKRWHTYHIQDEQEGSRKTEILSQPQKVRKAFDRHLKLYFSAHCSASVMLHDGLLWGRVYLPKPAVKSYQSSRAVYFVYFPQTPVVIVTGLVSAFQDVLTKVVLSSLGYTASSINSMELTGHHVEALAELAINKHTKGGFSKFNLSQRSSLSLSQARDNKRKVEETEFEDDQIQNENLAEKRRRLEILENNFGDRIQPTLERIEYKVELRNRGKMTSSAQSHVIHSRVKFTGTCALEGIRNLAASGLASVPLPSHLLCVPTQARNIFLLAESQKTSKKNSTAVS